MRFLKLKTNPLIIVLLITINGFIGYAQSTSETSLYNWYDAAVGTKNLAINNGTLHINPYKTIGDNTMYYITDKFSLGVICYEDQIYNDVNLKYDIYKDQLILRPSIESDYIGLNIILENTNSFILNGKNFINLKYNNTSLPESINGYYEVNLISDSNIFYIKHHKNRREIIKNNSVFTEFEEKNDFLLKYKNVFYKLTSINDLIKIFPDYKNKISDYAFKNKSLEKIDPTKFMENLMRYINFSN